MVAQTRLIDTIQSNSSHWVYYATHLFEIRTDTVVQQSGVWKKYCSADLTTPQSRSVAQAK
jgi:hypothetical protein